MLTMFLPFQYPQFVGENKIPPGKIHNFEQKMSRVKEVMKWADDIVGESKTGYVAGTEGISLADIFFVTSYTNIRALDYFDLVSTHEIHTNIFQKKDFS